jgi:hypothetical protein
MKLNFWQWLGVVMLLLATPLWIYNKITERKTAEMNKPSVTTPYAEDEPTIEPTTAPATVPA